MTEEVVVVMASHLENMPSDSGTSYGAHELRGPSAIPNGDSVFGARDPHFMLEMLGVSSKLESRNASLEWANSMWEAVDRTDRQNILPSTYILLDAPGESPGQIPLSKVFGSNDSDVVALKKEYDPSNVFDMAIPRLVNSLNG